MFHLSGSHQEEFRARFLATTVAIAVLFSVLFFRVWYLQILKGRKFKEFSEKNRISIKYIPAKRGRILDRNGIVIADSRPSFDLLVTPSKVPDRIDRQMERLGEMLKWNEEEKTEIFGSVKGTYLHDPVVLKRDMSRDEVAQVLVRQHFVPGVDVTHSPARTYPYGEHGSHFLGYLGEISRPQFLRLREQGTESYRLGDIWGVTGVEKAYEPILRGQTGARSFIEDAWGREVGEEISEDLLPDFRPRKPVAGHDLLLAIDSRVQEVAEQAFGTYTGAVVALDPNNGDVLALVSRPEYDPGNFVRGVSSQYWRELMRDPLNPLYDRALQGVYPPASTFKFVTALAALEANVINPFDTVYCPGQYRIGGEVKRCWKSVGHGPMNMHNAIKHSCDVYFYEIGKRLGIQKIADTARKFAFGHATGIGINRESDGLIPDEEWKRRVYQVAWMPGETLSVAIGQGAIQVTPLQMAVALSALVNGGTLYQPRIALQARTSDGRVTQSFGVKAAGKIAISEPHRELLLAALRAVVNETGGTAYWSARSTVVEMGGKTGTAQVVGRRSAKKIEDHSWFIAFAPVRSPQIVLAILVEHGGHGSTAAAPIAKQIVESYLGGTG